MTKVLVFGDSLFSELKFSTSNYHVESYPRHLACEMVEKLEIAVKEDNYNVVVLCLGINDLGHGKLPQDVVDSLKRLHDIVRKHSTADIVAMNLHCDYDLFNEMYGEQSDDDVYFCCFFYDLDEGDLIKNDIHLSECGTTHLSKYLVNFIKEEVHSLKTDTI